MELDYFNMLTFSSLSSITGGSVLQFFADRPIQTVLLDSRKKIIDNDSIFFAIKGLRNDGHQYILDLYEQGVRQFVVEKKIEPSDLPEANILHVNSSIEALQLLASHHRKQFTIPVIGITGSNGKTIVKEWLFQLLAPEFFIVKNPGSYNSQIGVPLSILQLQSHHQLGVFEAGISLPGEMERLASIIQPTIGIFTNLGSAHDEGFLNKESKLTEKLKLFNNCDLVIYCIDQSDVSQAIKKSNLKSFSWGFSTAADIVINKANGYFNVTYKGESFSLKTPFTDVASVENIFHCVAVMLHLDYSFGVIQHRIAAIRSVPMRLELKAGRNGCLLVNDTYNNDLAGLKISLEFLNSIHTVTKKRVILSDILQTGLDPESVAASIAELVNASGIHSFIGIGIKMNKDLFSMPSEFFPTTEAFLSEKDIGEFRNEAILIKGARPFSFERIVQKLEQKVHGTVMEVDLGNLIHNLNFFKSRLHPETKIMAMVKAFAYGSGSVEIANVLQYHRVDYLGVAYADEGIHLRENNITLPIMVMNPAEESYHQLITYNLEPEIFGLVMFRSFLQFLGKKQTCCIHIKLETGMNRLGIVKEDLPSLIELLRAHKNVKVASIFSHLAGADSAVHDEFSKHQVSQFLAGAGSIITAIGYRPILHILNSPGALRLPQFQMDMIRLGIGLYGIDPTEEDFVALKSVVTLKTLISQIKTIEAGETVGYNRVGEATGTRKIGVIAIGYADGFSRSFSNGVGSVLVNGKLAPIIGNVCMDMSMIDITDIEAQEGDEVILFGKELPITTVAKRINTIPYELLTNTSERVKRVFIAESI